MRRQRGIVLIIAIILSIIAVMFVAAATRLGMGGLSAGQNGTFVAEAERAAESGVQYALSQLRANPSWRGDRNRITVNSQDLFVIEDTGNVVGLVRTPDQRWSQFRLRFNYQDGATGEDGLPDPTMTLDSPYVCLNNLESGSTALVPRADGLNWSVTPQSARPVEAPARTVCLVVEGRSGPGLVSVTPANPNPGGVATHRVVEGIFALDAALGEDVEPSAMMAAQGVSVELPADGGTLSLSATGTDKAKLRSKGPVSVVGGAGQENLVGANAEVATPTSAVQARHDSSLSLAEEKPSDPFLRLLWDDVRKAQTSDPTLKAGTYVWWEDGSLHYYDMNRADYEVFIQAHPDDAGQAPVLGSAVTTEKVNGKLKLVVHQSLNVEPSATDELNIMVRSGAAEEPPASSKGGDDADALVSMASSDPKVLLKVLQNTQPLPPPDQYVGQGQAVLSDANNVVQGYLRWDLDSNTVESGGDLARLLWVLAAHPNQTAGDHLDGTFNMFNAYVEATNLNIDPGKGPGEITLPVKDDLTASDVELEFRGDQQEVVLTTSGSIYVTGGLRGQDASLVSAKDIKIVGMAVDFSASSQQAVSLYAQGDIVMSTLDKLANGSYGFQNVKMNGVVYTWGDFKAKLGVEGQTAKWGDLSLDGALVAYGGDPAGAPGANGKGNVLIAANQANLKFNSTYLVGLSSKLPERIVLRRISWSNNLP